MQDPDDAAYRDMPANALALLKPDYLVTADELAALLVRLVTDGQASGETPDVSKTNVIPRRTSSGRTAR